MLALLYWLVVSSIAVVCADYILFRNIAPESPPGGDIDMKDALLDYANRLAKTT